MLRPSVVLVAMLAGCQTASSPDPTRDALVDPGPVTPVVHEVYTGFAEPARFVVRDPERWAEVWNRAFAGRSEVPPRPTGYDISIDRVEYQDGAVAVDVMASSPDKRCYLLAVITSPVVMARTPKSRAPVQFIERGRIVPCE